MLCISAAFGKQKPKEHNFIEFYILERFYWHIVSGGFIKNRVRMNGFVENTREGLQ